MQNCFRLFYMFFRPTGKKERIKCKYKFKDLSLTSFLLKDKPERINLVEFVIGLSAGSRRTTLMHKVLDLVFALAKSLPLDKAL